MPRDASDLLHGTLDVLILKTLSLEPMHGFGIARTVGKPDAIWPELFANWCRMHGFLKS